MWVVVPVKPFALAKRRLSGLLTESERAELARAMLRDVLNMLVQCRNLAGCLVVSREPAVERLAQQLGVNFLREREPGLSKSAAQAAQTLVEAGESGVLVIPSDVPLATAREVDALIAGHGAAPCVSLVSDREGVGTNAIAMSPPRHMPFRFGRRSFLVHRALAEARGARVITVQAPGLALDIDTPGDLRRLLTSEAETESLAFLCDRRVAARVLPQPVGLAAALPW